VRAAPLEHPFERFPREVRYLIYAILIHPHHIIGGVPPLCFLEWYQQYDHWILHEDSGEYCVRSKQAGSFLLDLS